MLYSKLLLQGIYFISTFLIFYLAKLLNKVKYLKKLPAVITASAAVIVLLKYFNISFSEYNEGAKYVTKLLGPATIALAYPLVKNREILTKNKRAIYFGFLFATLVAFVSVITLGSFFHTEFSVIISMLPKSVTTPIAVEISKTIGGMPELTACAVVITGVLGAVFGRRILMLLGIKNDVAIGLSVGAASHVMGTSSLAERKQFKQVAVSTVALTVVAVLSAVIAPLLIKFYLKFKGL